MLSPPEPAAPYAGTIALPSTSANAPKSNLVSQPSRGKLGWRTAINDRAIRPHTPRLAPEPVLSGTDDPPDDWLGAQLSILSQADRSLRDGKPEEAMKSLEEYAALFPMGLLDPQVTLLRQRAQLVERRQVFIFP